MKTKSVAPGVLLLLAVLLCATAPATGGVHLWRIKEIFSNPDGTIQFIEIATCCGSTTETHLSGQVLQSGSHSFTFPGDVTGSTLNKHVLLGTSAFAALPGAPAPDHIIAANFFSTGADTISFSVYDSLTYPAGAVPTDGTHSLNKDPDDVSDTTFTAINSPRNYSDQTGSVNVASGPPAVPDGSGTTMPLTVSALTQDGSSLRLSFDTSTCANAAGYHILYGQRSGLPATPGGTFTLLGSVCGVGTTGPYDWTSTPSPVDGAGLLWFLMVATDSSFTEGSWGKSSGGAERNGPGNGGASGTCALVKSVANSCGNP